MTDPAQAQADATTTLASTAGKYTIDWRKPIGKGGMGTVYEAIYEKGGMHRPQVIKLLHFALAMTDDARKRLVDEARIACQFDHPNIVAVTDIGMYGDAPFIVMDRVDGVNLRSFQEAIGEPLELDICYYIAGCVAGALAHLHDFTIGDRDAGVVHSDVTPGNILISSSGEVKLTDFGISRFAHVDGTRTQPIGTPRYMSPEQRMGKTPRGTDVFSLGVVIKELLDSERFLAGYNDQQFVQAILNGDIPPFTRPGIPDWPAMLCRRMLSPRVEDRPPAREIREIILTKTPHFMLAAKKIEELYKRHIGPKRTGMTKLLNTADFFRQVPPDSAPIRIPLESSFSAPSAAPDERTVAQEGEDDAPSVFRRQCTPRVGGPRADSTRVTAETGTGNPMSVARSGAPEGGHQPADSEPPPLLEMPHDSAAPLLVDEPEPTLDESQEVEPTMVLDAPFPEPSGPEPTGSPSQPVATLPAATATVTEVRGRTAALWVLAGSVSLLVITLMALLVVLLLPERGGDTVATTPTQTAEHDRSEGEPDPASEAVPEVEAVPEIETVPEIEAVPEVVEPQVVEPEVVEPSEEPEDPEPDPKSSERSKASSSAKPQAATPAKPKKAVKKAEVVFLFPGHAAIEVGRTKLEAKSFARAKLPFGTHRVRWRALPDGPWHEVGELEVKEPPEGKRRQVTLTAAGMTLSFATVGSGK